ncbi:MAG: hypothetical protein ACRED1_13955, partial [Limisphaerales bacterium]
ARAGTITVVNLPSTKTDLATGITTNKHYVCAFDFGNNGTTPTINGVPFTHLDPGNQITTVTNKIDANFGGQVILTCTNSVNHPTSKLARTSNAGQGKTSSQVDGNTLTLLTDLIYIGASSPTYSWIQQEYDNLTIGDNYSLRLYYRYWGNSVGDRLQDVWFNGEGTWQPYADNPLDEDAGGAHYIEYDFTASATNAFCLMTNLVANGSPMLYGATLEDDSVPYAPFITYQPSAIGLGNGIYQFNAQAIGTASLTYHGIPTALPATPGRPR